MRCKEFLLLIFTAAPAVLAGPPHSGSYRSTDAGGAVLTGSFSESWMPGGAHGQPGNTVNAMSWDGTTLGAQWRLWCPSIAARPTLQSDTRNLAGTGDVTYRTLYSGGRFWFSGAGPWGEGANDFTGALQNFSVTAVYHFEGGALAGIRSSVSTLGTFDGFSQCLEYTINSAEFMGTTDYSAKPGEYPEFLAANCGAGSVDRGGWGSVRSIAMSILHCQVSAEPSAWGEVKRLYK